VRVDGQKPDMRRERRTSGQRTAKSTSIKDAERRSGDCARKAVELTPGELSCVAPVTEDVERHPDRRSKRNVVSETPVVAGVVETVIPGPAARETL
jgi:hypothetical protein